MLPNSANSSSPSNFVYLNNPVTQQKRFRDFFHPSPVFPPAPPPTPRLRDVTNWSLPPIPRKLVYDPETSARIAQEEKAMRQKQERQRQKALKAMQISEERRRRLQRQDVENLCQKMDQMSITDEQKKRKIFRNSLEEFKKDFPDKAFPEDSPVAQSTPIIRYTIEELKALRPLSN